MVHNLGVTIEKILSFWSQHNTVIIEALVAVVILFSLILAFRSFFGGKSQDGHSEINGGTLDTAQLEKTLQKILENQGGQGSAAIKLAENSDENIAHSVSEAGDSSDEILKLSAALKDSTTKIEVLKQQLAEAQSLASAAPTEVADNGLAEKERTEFNDKISDLEARLAEYEIISEDIADLSRYRDENEKLKAQLAAAPAQSPAAPAAVPEKTEVVEAVETVETVEVTTETSEASLEAELNALANQSESSDADLAALLEVPAATDESANLIDDELMREFEEAVKGQKGESKKAGDGNVKVAQTSDDTDVLMDKFENFVAKKS